MAKSAFRGSPRPSFSGGGQNAMMKQVQKMQEDMAKAQEEVEAAQYSAAAGGGVVTATVSGKKELISLVIEPDAVDPEDVEMLQDMIIAAVNEALRKAETAMSDSMGKFTGGLGGLGGLF
ncbi:MAG: YbaB/EbfC family nucleoid-associated protein [Oscillospiraceae bacterium]|jgi:DNA-binding YbaB/EbfC family protein|nr:YbaB/EbfC family nucleoid-associated protein [Oscillospiraceae bacterium]